jgi:hypothetical protein
MHPLFLVLKVSTGSSFSAIRFGNNPAVRSHQDGVKILVVICVLRAKR